MKKTLFTLNVDNYAPKIWELTQPLLKAYAKKIGADFYVINKRKYSDFPPVYEKLQIYDLGRDMKNDWNIFLDADVLVNPDMYDITEYLTKDTVCHNGKDMANIRWTYDRYFRRDGRNIGSCNWLAVASDWCIELWEPPKDITLSQMVKNIHPTINELRCGVTPSHLVDDYILSRNIAKYGLKYTTVGEINQRFGLDGLFYHQYVISQDQKAFEMEKILVNLGMLAPLPENVKKEVIEVKK